jgi:hypothetical protein
MAQPTFTDQFLTNVSNAWRNNLSDMIAERICPVVGVNKKTFKVASYSKENLRVPSSSVRTGESKSKRVNWGRDENTIGPLAEHSLSDFVTRDDQKMTDNPYDALSDATENILQKMALIDEKELATALANTAVVTQNVTKSGTGQWSDYANSNPFDDIKTGAITMKGSALKVPNTFFCSWETWVAMVDHPDFLDRIKWSQTGVMTDGDFVKLFAPYGINKIFVGKVSENTAVEGDSDSLSAVWGKHAWLGYVTDQPGLREVNGGYKFQLNGGRETTRETFNNPPGDEVVVRDYYSYEILNPECFYLIKNAVA